MVSALWNACAAEVEDVENVQQLLKDGADLEIKDHTGATALVQAVRNNHKQIVKALVAAGADVTQGKPESYTTDPETLALLRPAQEYPDGGFDPMQHYYYPPPGQEGPYPPYPYPVQPDQFDANAQGMPPPEVARSIPCRYFPGCRYGSSCMFLHPPAPYFAGPPPPHYPHMYPPHPYYMMRYPPPPPPPATDPATSPVTGTQPFPPIYPNGAPPFSPPTNGAPAFPNGAAYPNGAPYPPANGAPYPPTNGTPFSPASTGTPYTPATNGTHSPYGPPPFSPGTATPYSAGAPFTPAGPAPYPYPRTYPDAPKEPVNSTTEEPPAQTNNATTNGHPNGGFRRNTRGGRRESFGTRQQQKPPCLFFPSGRCRNGDECRFPHVPLEPGAQPPFRYPPGNGRFNHRPRQSIGHDNPPPAHIPPGTKLPFAPGGGQQRVPNADDFPVLGGDKAPAPSANGANGGLTAAQVLQAPAPAKKKDSDVVDGLADALSKVHVNGLATPAFEAPSTTPEITAVGA